MVEDIQYSRATTKEVSGIVVGVEADQIAVKDASKDLVAYWKDTVDLATRERGVKEEAELDVLLSVTNFLTQHGRQKHQVVVVNPDEIVVLYILCDFLCKQTIGFTVGVPC